MAECGRGGADAAEATATDSSSDGRGRKPRHATTVEATKVLASVRGKARRCRAARPAARAGVAHDNAGKNVRGGGPTVAATDMPPPTEARVATGVAERAALLRPCGRVPMHASSMVESTADDHLIVERR